MAIFQANYYSEQLHRDVPFNVFLPIDDLRGETLSDKPFPTVYLLHGLDGNYMNWMVNTSVTRQAKKHGFALVMPNGENSFYVDKEPNSNHFAAYIGDELVQATRRIFPLSNKRNETMICGFSMGGFGAMRLGMQYHETFGKIATISAAVHIFETWPVAEKYHEELWFGDYETAKKSEYNPRVLADALKEKNREDASVLLPRIYMTCGKSDGLLEANHIFYDHLMDSGFDVMFEEYEGIHSWDFVNERIGRVLDWMDDKEK